jgi:hypothetical protein
MLPLAGNGSNTELSMRENGCALLKLIGPSFVISHSGSAVYAIHWSDQCPDLIVGNVNLEPSSLPFQSLIGNATVPAVGRTRSRPWGLTTQKLNYSPAITNASLLNPVEVGQDNLANRSCFFQGGPTIYTLPNVNKVPYVAFTAEASPHITYDHCVIEYLKQVGGNPEWIKLSDLGIHGNGHFSYLEKNNLQVVAALGGWMKNHTKS